MNNPFMVWSAEEFARRLARESSDPAEQLRQGHRLLLGREPTLEERQELSRFQEGFGLPVACRLMFNLNEFLFVD